MNPAPSSAAEPQAAVASPEPPPEVGELPVLFYVSLALPVFAVFLFLMIRLFPGPRIVVEEEELPDDDPRA